MSQKLHELNYLLQLADNALILGHRLSEWCGHGPVLEQDIALTNMALDHIGQARSFFQYAAGLVNDLDDNQRQELFSSPAITRIDRPLTEDDLAFLRDAWDYKNILLVEQPNGDWATTVARSFFYDHFNVLLYSALQHAADKAIAAVAEKSLKEASYHKRWSSEWVIRLGDGTDESHRRMQAAIDDLWSYTGELFLPSPAESDRFQQAQIDIDQLKNNWTTEISAILQEATIREPAPDAWMQEGGKKGIHSEHLGYLLAEMQFMQRAYPDMQW